MNRTVFLLAAVVALPLAAHADTNKKPLANWTCADFTGTDDVFKPKVVYWATGAAKAGKPKTTTIDIVETEKIIPFVGEACEKNPSASFWHTVKAEWRKLKRSAERLEKKI